jgi:CyaY protein
MNESEFLTLAEQTLDAIERAVEACGADIEITRAGSVLTLELEDGSRIVVNSQTPMRQIWVAARSGGFHFERADDRWIDTRDHTELFAALSRIVSAQGVTPVVLPPQA